MVVLFKMFALLIFVFIVSSPTFGTADDENIASSRYDQEANCVLPSYPEHGKYTVKNYPSATPGEHYPSVTLDVSCDTEYQNENNINSIFCVNGFWSETMPKCSSFCTLINDLSVEYRCELSGPESLNGTRECESMVPSGTVVTPVCRSPGYYSLGVLAQMHCKDGIWDYKPTCKPVSSLTVGTADDENFTSSPYDQEANCVLPSYPEHGNYTVKNYPNAMPGESYPSVKVDVSCDTGYQNENNTYSIFCVNGYWSAPMPTCASFCTLINDLSVEYRCGLSGPGSFMGSRECESLVPSGTVVTPVCRSPGYYSLGVLAKMHCIDGIWDYNPTCKPACGTMSQHLQLEGTSNNHVELPWNAVIYMKFSSPYVESYMEICGGSLITSNTVISAAHCFWNDAVELLPASNYVVAVDKQYRPYNDPRDRNSQRSNVVDIKISSYFHGAGANYQDDIAMLVVETPFVFSLSVRPVCLNFDYHLDKTQLTEGNSGIAAGWSIVAKNGQASQVLKVVDIPYLKLNDCYDISPTYFREYLTSDKFCAGSSNGTWFCKGDSGAGLAFLEPTTQRYYLRGILSVSPTNEDDCSSFNTFTSIKKHEYFIKQHL